MDSNLCPKCKKPIESSSTGIVSQLVETCQCSLKVEEQGETITICAACKKRIPRKSGTMTQWIFGQGSCSCQSPKPVDKPLEEVVYPSFVGSRGKDETYLDLGADKFPIERYKAIAELGKGAAGLVYLGRDKLLDKKVAVKTLLDLTPDQLISFQEEAKATAKLDHPNIIKILDFGSSHSGTPYMVMNYVPGISLEKYLKENNVLDEHMACIVFAKLADALSYAHKQKVFHRDIKPSNILLSEENEEVKVCLIDFGVAKVKESTGISLTIQNRTLAGTPQYMSPDPVRGEDYDEQSEIYSIGCVMFEALAGRPPFDGETAMEILSSHSNNVAPFLKDIRKDISLELSLIIDKCLQKQKALRYSSMAELALVLNEATSMSTEYGVTASRAPSPYKKIKMHYIWLFGATITFALLIFAKLMGPGPSVESVKRSDSSKSDKVDLFKSPFSAVNEDDTYLDNEALEKSLARQKGLKHLIVKLADLSGDTLSTLDNMPSTLCLFESCKLDSRTFVHLSKLKGLKTLKLLSCNFDLDDFQLLNDCKQLKSLTYTTTDYQNLGYAIYCLSKVDNLKDLSLRCGYTAKPLDSKSLVYLKKMQNLEELKLITSNIDRPTLETIAKLKNLKSLRLASCVSLNKDIELFEKSRHLKSLSITSEVLDEKLLLGLAKLRSIEILQFEQCQIVDEHLIGYLGSLPRLEYLDLTTSSGPISWTGANKLLKNLKELRVAEVTPSLKEEIKTMSLKYLRVKEGLSAKDRIFFKTAKPDMKVEIMRSLDFL